MSTIGSMSENTPRRRDPKKWDRGYDAIKKKPKDDSGWVSRGGKKTKVYR